MCLRTDSRSLDELDGRGRKVDDRSSGAGAESSGCSLLPDLFYRILQKFNSRIRSYVG